MRVRSVEDYEDLAAQVEHVNQQLLRAHPYNTVGNLVRFYSAYSARGDGNAERLFREYQPAITAAHHTCVGLGLTLLRQLRQHIAKVQNYVHLVSSEEAVDNTSSYVDNAPHERSEKEHVLVAAWLDIAGRKGIMLLDPGYHVARVVTVMADGMYPHTGWFTQTDDPEVRREYQYILVPNEKYVLWTVRETRGDQQTSHCNLIYIEKAYLSAVDVTERRNIVYNFRSLLARNTKGQVTAGLYFPMAIVNEDSGPACTVFYTEADGNRKRRVKIPFHRLIDPEGELEVEQEMALVLCSRQLGMPDDRLEEMLVQVGVIFTDKRFISQVLAINEKIGEMSEEN